MPIPVIDPQRNCAAMHLPVVGYFSRRNSFPAHRNPLDAEHFSWLLILLCLPSKFQQLGYGGPVSFGECWAHIPSLPTLLIMSHYLCAPIQQPYDWLPGQRGGP